MNPKVNIKKYLKYFNFLYSCILITYKITFKIYFNL